MNDTQLAVTVLVALFMVCITTIAVAALRRPPIPPAPSRRATPSTPERYNMSETISDYQAVGGGPAIRGVVDDFYRRILADERLIPFFNGVDMTKLKRHQAALISQVMGGPVGYTGRELSAAHRHLAIDDAAFGRVAVHLDAALLAAGVPGPIRQRTMDAVGKTHDDVVTA